MRGELLEREPLDRQSAQDHKAFTRAHVFVGTRELRAQGDYVSVVMLARELYFLRIPRQGCAHARDFIGRDGHADSGGAYQNPAVGLA